jgi:hypothetical protein
MELQPLFIRCVRVDNDKTKDDLITILPNDTGDYSIKTFYADINKSYTETLSYINVFGYVHSLLTLMNHDDKPFVFVQFDIPNTPPLAFNVKNLDCERVINAINTMLHITIDAWNIRMNQICY